MSLQFILDENVVILAQLGEGVTGESDPTCLSLVQQIIDICHTFVVDPALWEKYYRQLNQPRHAHPQEGVRLIRSLTSAVQRTGKVDIGKANAAPFREEDAIPPGSWDDLGIVRLAVETGAALVTTDENLREDLISASITATHDLRVLSPAEALDNL